MTIRARSWVMLTALGFAGFSSRALAEMTAAPPSQAGTLTFALGPTEGELLSHWLTLPDFPALLRSFPTTRTAKPEGTEVPLVIFVGAGAEAETAADELEKKMEAMGTPAVVIPMPAAPAAKPPTLAGTIWEKTIGKFVADIKKAAEAPTPMEVSMGFVSGTYRFATSTPIWIALGINPVATAAVVAVVTSRTTARDIFIRTVDNFYKGEGPQDKAKPAAKPTAEEIKTWGAWGQKIRKRLTDIAGRQVENLFFLELIRTIATVGGVPHERIPSVLTASGQADIFLTVMGPGFSGAYLGTVRSHALANPRARAWWNFNTFLANAVFQNLMWAGLGGPTLVDTGFLKLSTVLATNIAHDILLAGLMKRFPGAFETIAQGQDYALEKVAEAFKATKHLVTAPFLACRTAFGSLLGK